MVMLQYNHHRRTNSFHSYLIWYKTTTIAAPTITTTARSAHKCYNVKVCSRACALWPDMFQHICHGHNTYFFNYLVCCITANSSKPTTIATATTATLQKNHYNNNIGVPSLIATVVGCWLVTPECLPCLCCARNELQATRSSEGEIGTSWFGRLQKPLPAVQLLERLASNFHFLLKQRNSVLRLTSADNGNIGAIHFNTRTWSHWILANAWQSLWDWWRFPVFILHVTWRDEIRELGSSALVHWIGITSQFAYEKFVSMLRSRCVRWLSDDVEITHLSPGMGHALMQCSLPCWEAGQFQLVGAA